jgi:ABC-2 type transport system ATP-binding protein
MAGTEMRKNRYRVQLALAGGSDPGREISAAVVGMGLGLYEMRRVQVSLEDVFLELTTEEKPVDSEAIDPPDESPKDQSATGA